MKSRGSSSKYLVFALAVPAFLDVFLTLLGQPDCYWDHFLKGAEKISMCSASEVALFGFGEMILETHPLLFLFTFTAFFAVLSLFIMRTKSVKVALFLYWLPYILHIKGAFSWVEKYFDSGVLWMSVYEFRWVVWSIFCMIMLAVALWGQKMFLNKK